MWYYIKYTFIVVQFAYIFYLFGVLFPLISPNDRKQAENLTWWDGGECSNNTPVIYENKEVYGHCGRRASALGPGQKVISMNIYGKNPAYYRGIEENLNRMKYLYPGYNLRLYADPRMYKDLLCPLLLKYDHLFVCDIKNLPSGIGNINNVQRSSWRFSPMGDVQVDIVLFRDSDSKIIMREVSAVQEWLLSKTTMHVMKDWPRIFQNHKIFAGLWGLRFDLGKMYSMGVDMRSKINIIREQMFQYLKGKKKYGDDQNALRDYVWPALRNDVVIHDCFYCKQYPESWPWPTKRNGTNIHVGMRDYRPYTKGEVIYIPDLRCPLKCRPPNHKNWTHC